MVIFHSKMLNYQRVTTKHDRPMTGDLCQVFNTGQWPAALHTATWLMSYPEQMGTDGNRWTGNDGYISSTRTQYPHLYRDCPVQLSHLNEQKHLPSMNPYQPCLTFLISFARLKRLPSKLWRGPTLKQISALRKCTTTELRRKLGAGMCWQSLLEYKQITETTDKDWTSMIAHNRTLRADTTKDQNRAKSLKAGGSGFEHLL